MRRRDDPDEELPRERLLEQLQGARKECERLLLENHELRTIQEQADQEARALLEAQGTLEQSRDRYATLYDFAPVAYVTLDGSGLMRDLNLTAAAMFESDRARLLDRPLFSLVAKEDHAAFFEHLRRCRTGESPVRSDATLRRARGALPVELVSVRMLDMEGGFSFPTVLLDQTGRLAAEREWRASEEEQRLLLLRAEGAKVASEAKDRFLATLSHELRGPLTPVLMALDGLERGEENLERRSRLALIRRNVETEVRLLDDLLEVTRAVRGKLRLVREAVDLHSLLEEVREELAQMAEGRRVRLERRLAASETTVDADPFRIRQVVRNLAANALKFTPEGGQVEIATDSPRLGWIRVEVSDTGAGLSREDLARIFEPFEQAGDDSREGLGLGLTIAKSIVEAHEGQIRGYSAGVGRGARFAFELPLSARKALRAPTLGPAAASPVETLRVLVVEDDRDTAEMLSIVLNKGGYQVLVAHSLDDAVRVAEQGCDLVLSDLRLADGNGHSLLERLPRRLPAIVLSGYGTPEDVQRSIDAGYAEHLVKPVSPPVLLAALARVAGLRR